MKTKKEAAELKLDGWLLVSGLSASARTISNSLDMDSELKYRLMCAMVKRCLE